MIMPQPASQVPGDPYYDPGHWNRNPNLPDFGTPNRAPCSVPNHGYGDSGYVGSEYNANDRSSKRLRVDGMPYGGGGGGGSDSQRMLKLVRDHGVPNSYPAYITDTNGYGPENQVFDRNFDGREPPSNSSNVGYQKEEVEYQSGYGSHHGIKGSVLDAQHGYMASKFQDHPEPQLPLYGNAARPQPPDNQSLGYHHSDYGSSHVSNGNFYGNKFQPMPSENASLHYEQRSNMPMSTHYSAGANHSPFPNTIQQPAQMGMGYDYHSPTHLNDVRQPLEPRSRPIEGYQAPLGNQNVRVQSHYGSIHMDNQGGHGNSVGHWRASQGFDVRPPLPASPPPPPPPPLPVEPPGNWSAEPKPPPSPPRVSSSLFPIPVSSSGAVQPSYAAVTDSHMRASQHLHNSHLPHPPRGLFHGVSAGFLKFFPLVLVQDKAARKLTKFFSQGRRCWN